jgi:hypothetical protein
VTAPDRQIWSWHHHGPLLPPAANDAALRAILEFARERWRTRRAPSKAAKAEAVPPQLKLSGGSGLLQAHRYRWTTLHKNQNSLYTILATSA